MSIVESLTGNSKRRHDQHPAAPPPAPHANTAQALAFVQSMQQELEFLRETTDRQRVDLTTANARIRDLEREREATRGDLEAYRRYSVTVKTHLQHIVDSATRANEEAIEAGEHIEQPVKRAEKVVADTKHDLREMTAKP